jgi:Uma2 family endonuclease
MRMALPTYYTAEMVRQFPDDGNRYEVVHGELLVTPAPRALHQLVVQRLVVALDGYLRIHRVGVVLSSPADISWAEDVLVQPDVFVVDLAEARTLDWASMKHLLLAIEALSPSSSRADRFTKRRLYQEVGIPAYWMVDADARQVEVWAPGSTRPRVERERAVWVPAGIRNPFVVELSELFAPIP